MADVTKTLKDAAYVVIGLGVLGFQKVQVRRNELTKQLGQPKADPDSGVLTFKGRPTVQLDGESGAISVYVGTLR